MRVKYALMTIFVILLGLVALSYMGVLPYKLEAVKTGSMEPVFPVRSAVLIHDGSYEVGQPVYYQFTSPDGTVNDITHRLVSINADGTITTKGDANRSPDPWHPPVSSIVGGAVADIPNLGWLIVYLRQPTGAASLFLVFVIVWLMNDLLKIMIPSDKEAKEAQTVPAVS